MFINNIKYFIFLLRNNLFLDVIVCKVWIICNWLFNGNLIFLKVVFKFVFDIFFNSL